MLIYMRHADDNESSAEFSHDHRVTEQGRHRTHSVTKKLVEKYGPPDLIMSSPMHRGKETVDAMLEVLSNKPKVAYDKDLSRYFNSVEQAHPDVCSCTLKEKIPIYESREDFKKRCAKVLKKTKKIPKDKVVYIITHYLIMKFIADYYDITLPEHMPFLDYFYIAKKSKKKRDS
jgi:broad specificity phosphatase PhoE